MKAKLGLVLGWMALGALGCSDDGATTTPTDDGGGSPDAITTGDASPTDSGPTKDAAADATPVDDPGPAPTQTCTYTKDNAGFFKLTSPSSDYWVRLPPTYDEKAPKPTRLLVALHGCGDTALNFATWGAAPQAIRATQDYIAISIGGRDGQCWTMNTDGALATAAITHLRSCFYVHQKKIVLAGYSSGGMLAYRMGFLDAGKYAGILIENSGLSQGVGNVATALSGAAWKINVAHSARTEDQSFLIAGVRSDRDKMIAASFPLQYRELPGDHNGTSDDWSGFLLPKMATWAAP